MSRVALATLGCKVNQFDTQIIEGLFKQHGYIIVPFEEQADIYIINTCAVTHLGEKKSRKIIRRAIRVNPAATIVVTGCYAQISCRDIAAIDGVDLIIGTQERHNIVELTEQAIKEKKQLNAVKDIMTAEEFENIPLFKFQGRTRAFLKIQEGCNNFCSYCIIPYTRGPLRSRELQDVVAETDKLLQSGFKEIVLTGIHLGAYGVDLSSKPSLADVATALLRNKLLMRLRLGSLESIEISDELLKLIKENNGFCRHLHLPLQSGSDLVLAAMNRHYTTQEYRELITNIREKIDEIAISTDVIVGFPGETDKMFQETMDFIYEMNFSRVHVFPYSPRKGTPAARMDNQISMHEKQIRVKTIEKIAECTAENFNKQLLGKKTDVLFESHGNGIMEGLTDNYVRIYSKFKEESLGEIKMIVPTKKYRDGLWGELVN